MKNKIFFNLCLCILLGTLPLARTSGASQETTDALARLQALTSSVATIRCDFTQRTDIALFAEPVVSRGRMRFQSPNKLVWEIEEPVREGFVLNGNSGYRWEENKRNRRPFRTSADPLAKLVSQQILAWITFDQKWLLSKYSITVERENPFHLILVPKNLASGVGVSSIRIVFADNGVASSVELQEAKSNKTTITFGNSHVNEHIDSGEFE
ncbi:MAG: outer membrane lipoprotein carrier protein LolA [Desulfovibrio sp.]|jgi:outer membrane lipoprotein-sorting protein|nr:outer membrane lipoprotein carrier protein LolA [Desulfovibrio sp.]